MTTGAPMRMWSAAHTLLPGLLLGQSKKSSKSSTKQNAQSKHNTRGCISRGATTKWELLQIAFERTTRVNSRAKDRFFYGSSD